jgi:hypothetical protein
MTMSRFKRMSCAIHLYHATGADHCSSRLPLDPLEALRDE